MRRYMLFFFFFGGKKRNSLLQNALRVVKGLANLSRFDTASVRLYILLYVLLNLVWEILVCKTHAYKFDI